MTTLRHKHIVGISDVAVSSDPDDLLITYALGSCLGITVYDPEQQVGGLLHAMLPVASINRSMAAAMPATFVDTGVELLLGMCEAEGARRRSIIVTASGGAEFMTCSGVDAFRVGHCNLLQLHHTLKRHGLNLESSNTDGNCARTVSLAIDSGSVIVTETLPSRRSYDDTRSYR